jgi:aspartate carbamoyltransferase catalytic subunit
MDGWPCTVRYDLDEAIAADSPDAIMMLRVQRERMSSAGGGFFPSPLEYHRRYGLDGARLRALPGHAIVMHPGPMNRGLEISAEAADSPRSVVVEQVANGVSVRMAVLYLLLAGEEMATPAEAGAAPAAAPGSAPAAAPAAGPAAATTTAGTAAATTEGTAL